MVTTQQSFDLALNNLILVAQERVLIKEWVLISIGTYRAEYVQYFGNQHII